MSVCEGISLKHGFCRSGVCAVSGLVQVEVQSQLVKFSPDTQGSSSLVGFYSVKQNVVTSQCFARVVSK